MGTTNVLPMVNIHEAKTNLSKLIENSVKNNKEFIIAKSGVPIVKITPIKKRSNVVFGLMKDSIWVSDDFDMPSEEIKLLFEGEYENIT